MNPHDVWDIVRVAMTLGSVLLTVGICAIVLNMIRPKKSAGAREPDPAEAEEMWRIVDMMESRLEVLERALADQIERPRSRDFLMADGGRDSGRTE